NVCPIDRNFGNVVAPKSGDKKYLDVEGETIQVGDGEKIVGYRSPEHLEPALRVVQTGKQQALHYHVECVADVLAIRQRFYRAVLIRFSARSYRYIRTACDSIAQLIELR